MTPEDALSQLHQGTSRIDLEHIVKNTGGVWEHIHRTGEYRIR